MRSFVKQLIHSVNVLQAYGMMGWRIGYIAFPDYAHHYRDVEGNPEEPEGPKHSTVSNGTNDVNGLPVAQPFKTAPGALGAAQLKVRRISPLRG